MKFLALLKKEVRELLTKQTIVMMVCMLGLFYALGGFMGNVMDDISSSSDNAIVIIDNDKTEFTEGDINAIKQLGNEVRLVDETSQDKAQLLKYADTKNLVIITKGFTSTIFDDNKMGEIVFVGAVENSSITSLTSSGSSQTAVAVIQQAAYNALLQSQYNVPLDKIEFLSKPVVTSEYCVVNGNTAKIGSTELVSYMSTQGIIVPIVVLILILFASQMIIGAISTEKIDKTLETLLSAPVSRLSVLTAKMVAAAFVALLQAAVYMLGFSKYMSTMLDASVTGGTGDGISEAVSQLGLTMSTGNYILLGIQLFLSILITLSISLVLGALANDAKSVQTMILPITILAMIPYMVSLLADINSMSLPVRLLIYAIPYTHTFTATSNLLFGNMTLFFGGLLYQIVFFAICLFIALRIFSSDKIFTMSLNFGQKRRFLKNNNK